MAARGNLSVKPQKVSQGYGRALASAVLEWLLIFFLFIDAILSFLITTFADYCELQTPCLLCSRLDHVLSNKRLNYYWDLICSNHKLEISSLVFCHAHNKLVDVHGMCKNCLLSFATINKSNAETYQLLVGNVGAESSFGFDKDPLLEGQHNSQSSIKRCSCCYEPWILRVYVEKLIQQKSIDSKISEFEVPLSGACGHTPNYQRSDRPSVSNRCTELIESESGLLSDDDASDLALERLLDPISAVAPSLLDPKEKSDVIDTHKGTSVASSPAGGHGSEELNWEKVDFRVDHSPCSDAISVDNAPPSSNAGKTSIDASKETKFISLDTVFTLSNEGKASAVVSKASELLNRDVPPLSNSTEDPVDVSREREPISPDEVLRSSNAVETPVDVAEKSKAISLNEVPLSSNDSDSPSEVSKDSKVALTDDGPPMSGAMESPVKAPKENCVTRSAELQETSVVGNEEICKTGSVPNTSNETAAEKNSIINDTGLDLTDAYKVAVGNRGRQLSGVLAEQRTGSGKDSSRNSEDRKLLLSQLSASDTSPKVSINGDEVKTSDASSSNGMQKLQKLISLERNESGLESLDGSVVSEIEGENLVDRLKRQIEHDKKLLTAVYKELEEERNASAVAVNQAMAMITRLQEEKASFHMEALQNLRMMEEQAEYDMEALQSTNDLLAEKEKDLQDLEDELEFFKQKYPNESMLENIFESTHDLETREIKMDNSDVSRVKESTSADTESVTGNPKMTTLSKDMNAAAMKNPLLDFEDERLYILQNLKKLEKQLYTFSYNGLCSDSVNDKYNVNEGDAGGDSKDHNCEGDCQLNSKAEVKDSPMLNDASASKGIPCNDDVHVSSLEKPQLSIKENVYFDCSEQCSSVACTGTNLVSLGNEVSNLNERLEALEADQNFLELTINLLKKGEGVQFIREIASHLQVLRRVGIQRRDYSVA